MLSNFPPGRLSRFTLFRLFFFIRKYFINSRDRRDKPLQTGQHAVHEEAQLLHLQGGGSLLLHQDYQQNVHLQTGTPLLFTARLIRANTLKNQ